MYSNEKNINIKKTLQILHVTPHYEPAFEMGGIVGSLSQLCRGLVKLGQDVTVFTINNNRLGNRLNIPVNQEVDVGGVRVWYFPAKFLNKKFFYAPDLGKACYERMREFDVMHLTSFWCYPGIPAGKVARRFNIPYFMSPRGTLIPYCLEQGYMKKKLYLNLFDKKNLEGASAIHYTSELERESTHQYNKLKNPSFIVPNPVPIDEITDLPGKEESREFLSLPIDANVISYVGRLNKRKALDVLILSFKKILSKLNNCYLLIAGPDDGDESRLKQLVIKNDLSKKVIFWGFVNTMKRGYVLGASDLFWFATYPGENFGNAAVEAMAAGLPVILSEYVGIYREILQDDAGITVSHNIAEIVKKVGALLLNEQRRMIMSENAKKTILKYATDVVASSMLKAYKDVLTGRRSPELQWKQ